MSKTKYIELLLQTIGLTNIKVRHIMNGACDEHVAFVSWEVESTLNETGTFNREFHSFNSAVREIIEFAVEEQLETVWVDDGIH